jgi:hypothetical protein
MFAPTKNNRMAKMTWEKPASPTITERGIRVGLIFALAAERLTKPRNIQPHVKCTNQPDSEDVIISSNFAFLAEHDPVFLQLAGTAEQVFAADPNTTLIKLRQLGEALAQDIAARAGVEFDGETTQADLLSRLGREIRLDATVRNLFHTLRIEGNKATHQFRTRHKEAMDGLKLARALAVWFHQSFGKAGAGFQPGPFIAPGDPSQTVRQLQSEITQLRAEVGRAKTPPSNPTSNSPP